MRQVPTFRVVDISECCSRSLLHSSLTTVIICVDFCCLVGQIRVVQAHRQPNLTRASFQTVGQAVLISSRAVMGHSGPHPQPYLQPRRPIARGRLAHSETELLSAALLLAQEHTTTLTGPRHPRSPTRLTEPAAAAAAQNEQTSSCWLWSVCARVAARDSRAAHCLRVRSTTVHSTAAPLARA